MASTSDLFTDTENGGPPEPTTASAERTSGATTLQCEALTNWPTDTAVHFVTGTPTTDAEGNPIINPETLCLWKGVVSGSNIVDMVLRGSPADADPGNNINDLVQMAPTSSWFHDFFEAATEDHDTEGHHLELHDTNGNPIIDLGATASAVNNLKVSNAATTGAPKIAVEGSDTNINLALAGKGSGFIQSTPPIWQFLGYAQITSNSASHTSTNTQVIGLTVTVAIPAGATRVRIKAYCSAVNMDGAGTPNLCIYDGVVGSGTRLVNTLNGVTSAYVVPLIAEVNIPAPAAGSKTYNVGLGTSAANATIFCGTDSPAFIQVECC